MISSNARFWIWLTLVLGYNTDKINRLYDLYDNIAEFCQGGEDEWRFCGIFTPGELKKLRSVKIHAADKIIKRCEELGYSIISIDDKAYPECLRNIYASPAVLYVEGELPDIDNILSVGIVGTRRASSYGTNNAYKFGYALSKCGVIVVSGGALGVDCASHRGTLAAKGKTICVLGCGINYNYLSDNKGMRDAITKDGAVISEYPPDTPPMGYQFPARNRIIAALSDGVLIIESGSKSGSLITANLALEMGKELFALLGNNSPQNEGSNARIKEGTAIPVTDFMDILSSFDNIYIDEEVKDIDSLNLMDVEEIPVKGVKPSKSVKAQSNAENEKPANEKPKRDLKLEGDMKKVYEFLSAEPVHIDEIAAGLNMPVFKVSVALTQLQIIGVAGAEPGRRFFLK